MKTLIILHGWQSSKEKWQKVKEKINENGSCPVKVLVPDLPGFKKETALDKPWNLDDYVEWFKNFSSKTCPERALRVTKPPSVQAPRAEGFFLLGHSFGGRIAIKFAQKYPEKIKGLILVSAAGIKPKKNLCHRLISACAKIGRRFTFLPFYSFFREIFYKYILRRTDYIKAEKFPYLKETFKNIIKEDLKEYFSKIKVPTLIIWGGKDKITPVSDAYLMNQKILNSKLQILQGIGHFPYIENPKLLCQKIKDFISF